MSALPTCSIKVLFLFLALAFCCCPEQAWALSMNDDVSSDGGLVPGSKIVHVTSLADDGEGTLRQALSDPDPCVVVFDVAGVIRLRSDLTIAKEHVTLAGETAPSSGILLYGGTLRVRASNVVISHIAIYPGASDDPQVAEKRDGISVFGSVAKKNLLTNIVLRNVSVAWSVDENIGLQGLTDGVRIERSLIAHGLNAGGHPKGPHSMNLLLGNTVGRVVIVGSVFAGSNARNPRLLTGNRVSFLNNLIVGNGRYFTQLDTSTKIVQSGYIDLIGNVYVATQATKCGRTAIYIDDSFLHTTPRTEVYLNDNLVINQKKKDCLTLVSNYEGFSQKPLTSVPSWPLLSAKATSLLVLQKAGSHPLHRNPIDQRLVEQIKEGTVALIGKESDIGGMPDIEPTLRKASVPIDASVLESEQDVTCLKQWLTEQDRQVTGQDGND